MTTPTTTTLTYRVQATLTEVLSAADVPGAASAAARTLVQTKYDTATRSLDSGTTTPVTCGALFSQALAAGVATIDLTALDGSGGRTVDGTGLRVQVLRVKNPGTNTNPISIAKGAANGYDGLGANFKVTLEPGAEATFLLDDAGGNIGGANKTLDLAGTLIQELEVEIVMG